MSNRLSALLLLLGALLGSLVYVETRPENNLRRTIPAGAPVSPRQGVKSEPATSRFTLPDVATLTETVDRPLFSPGRRPPATPDEPVQTVEAIVPLATDPVSFSLSAVIINGAQRMALLQGQASGAGVIRAEEGQTVEGWLVEEVQPERVVLRRGEQQQELMLRKFQPPPQALRPAAAPGKPPAGGRDVDESQGQALDLRRPRRPLRGPRLRSRKRNANE